MTFLSMILRFLLESKNIFLSENSIFSKFPTFIRFFSLFFISVNAKDGLATKYTSPPFPPTPLYLEIWEIWCFASFFENYLAKPAPPAPALTFTMYLSIFRMFKSSFMSFWTWEMVSRRRFVRRIIWKFRKMKIKFGGLEIQRNGRGRSFCLFFWNWGFSPVFSVKIKEKFNFVSKNKRIDSNNWQNFFSPEKIPIFAFFLFF